MYSKRKFSPHEAFPVELGLVHTPLRNSSVSPLPISTGNSDLKTGALPRTTLLPTAVVTSLPPEAGDLVSQISPAEGAHQEGAHRDGAHQEGAYWEGAHPEGAFRVPHSPSMSVSPSPVHSSLEGDSEAV